MLVATCQRPAVELWSSQLEIDGKECIGHPYTESPTFKHSVLVIIQGISGDFLWEVKCLLDFNAKLTLHFSNLSRMTSWPSLRFIRVEQPWFTALYAFPEIIPYLPYQSSFLHIRWTHQPRRQLSGEAGAPHFSSRRHGADAWRQWSMAFPIFRRVPCGESSLAKSLHGIMLL